MGQYRLSRTIQAPPDRVFDGLVDPATFTDWMDLQAVRDASGPLGTAGTTFTMVVFRFHWFRSRIDRSERPTLHEWSGTGRLGMSYRMRATLRPDGSATILDLDTEYTLPFGPIGRWLDRRFVDRPPRAMANRELDRLVELVSAPA